jgi:transposase
VDEKRQRKPRQTIDLEQLKNNPNSFLWLRFDDPVLRKLETYRLYRVGYAAEDIAKAFGYARPYLYELWGKFEQEGSEAFVDKHWGTVPRQRTTVREAQVLRAKALHPERGDSELAQEFGMDRSTIYLLLKEHDMQDLHRVVADADQTTAIQPESEGPTSSEDDEKGGVSESPASTLSR